jgi:hypothetical protein
MSFFDGGPLAPWPDSFSFPEDLGCGWTLLGFVLFLVVVFVVSQFFF